ncbi:MAG: acyl carrier protein [Lachnospiraceae bacterium]|nr:acyl carrier protein [Lachnospiraceae bacterium]
MWKNNEIKEIIVDIIKELIKDISLDLLQADADLVDLGLDSVVFVQLIVELEEKFQVDVPDEVLFISELNTINKMTQLVENLLGDN